MKLLRRFKRWIWTITHIEAIIDHERSVIEHDYVRIDAFTR